MIVHAERGAGIATQVDADNEGKQYREQVPDQWQLCEQQVGRNREQGTEGSGRKRSKPRAEAQGQQMYRVAQQRRIYLNRNGEIPRLPTGR